MEDNIIKFVHKHQDLLLQEREADLENLFKDFSSADLHLLESKNQALTKLTVINKINKGIGQFQIDLARADDSELNFGLQLNPGDLVLCLRQNKIKNSIRGVISNITQTHISIDIKDNFEDPQEDEQHFSVIKTDSDITYIKQNKALSQLEKKYSVLQCYSIIQILFENDKNVMDHLLTAEDSIPKEYLDDNNDLKFINSKLVEDQKSAVLFALKRRYFAIIQGPPGTGKTTTLIELISQLHRLNKKVLVCAPTNVAVDNVVMQLSKTNIKPLRLGHISRIDRRVEKFSLDFSIKNNDNYSVLHDIERSLHEMTIKSENSKIKMYKEMHNLRKEHKKRFNKLTSEILRNSSVILCTLNSANPKEGHLQNLPEDFFDIVIVDEASQAMEASMWIALPNARKVVMAGDINQLPPVVMSQKASEDGLSLSLMERAINTLGKKSFVSLTKQYRMHEHIMSWPSKNFYKNTLTADETVKCHLLKDLPGVKSCAITDIPLIFIDTCGCECDEYQKNTVSGSKGNPGEAVIVNKIVLQLTKVGVSPKDIGIITPYSLQVEFIRKSLNANSLNVEVKTVDGFQGREKEIIILSCVRSNQEKELGFVTDYRRLNVAITRAKRCLVLIADSETMEKNKLISALLKHIEEYGLIQTAEEYLTGEYDKKEEMKTLFTAKNTTKSTKIKTNKIKKESDSDFKQPKKGKTLNLNDQGESLENCYNKKSYNVYESITTDDVSDDGNVEEENTDVACATEKKEKKKGKKKTKEIATPRTTCDNDNFDAIIAEFSQTNYVCSFDRCKVSTKLIHIECEFCKKWYCLEHGMQEIHGCGEAVKKKERKEFRHPNVPTISEKERIKFSQKLKKLEEARKPKKKAAK